MFQTSVFQAVKNAVVTVYQAGGTGASIGTGWVHDVIDHRLIVVTAAHLVLRLAGSGLAPQQSASGLQILVRGAYVQEIQGTKPKDVQVPVVVLSASVNDNIAILATADSSTRFDPRRQPTLCFASQACRVGDSVTLVGVPFGFAEPQPSFGEVRDCSLFPLPQDPQWNPEAAQMMVTAPAAAGNAGAPIFDVHARVISQAHWRLSSTSTFIGGPERAFFAAVVAKLVSISRANIAQVASPAFQRVDFRDSTGKGSIGILAESGLVGSTLRRLRATYPQFAGSAYDQPLGRVILQHIPVFLADCTQVGSIQAGLHVDDVILAVDGVPLDVGDSASQHVRDIYFRTKDSVLVEYLRPSTMTVARVAVTIGQYPFFRESVGSVDEYMLIDRGDVLNFQVNCTLGQIEVLSQSSTGFTIRLHGGFAPVNAATGLGVVPQDIDSPPVINTTADGICYAPDRIYSFEYTRPAPQKAHYRLEVYCGARNIASKPFVTATLNLGSDMMRS
jgi:hypothetical protein